LFLELKRNAGIEIHYVPLLKEYSKIEETLEDFEKRISEKIEDVQEQELEKVQKKYEKKIENIQNKLEQKKLAKERQELDAKARKRDEMVSGAETVLGWVMGRRRTRALSTASIKRMMRKMSEERIKATEEKIRDYQEELKNLKEELEEELDQIEDKYDDALEEIRPIEIKLQKKDITVSSFGLVWIPVLKVKLEVGSKVFNAYTGEPLE
jgi:DNA repair exonuclease SbcCD ATPase subunit